MGSTGSSGRGIRIIRSGSSADEYALGQRLPGINDLRGEYGVTHLTANKALPSSAHAGPVPLFTGC
jgi:hypothetical protein